jgi:hypothetical protein
MIVPICSCGHTEADHGIKDIDAMAARLLGTMVIDGMFEVQHYPDRMETTYSICGETHTKTEILERVKFIIVERSHCRKKSFFKKCQCTSFQIDNLRTLEHEYERKASQIIY